MFTAIVELAISADRNDIADFAKKEIALLNKRNSISTKAQQAKEAERETLAEAILLKLQGTIMRTTDIAAAVGISPQKATPILKRMTTNGKITVIKGKRGVNLYTTIETAIDEELPFE